MDKEGKPTAVGDYAQQIKNCYLIKVVLLMILFGITKDTILPDFFVSNNNDYFYMRYNSNWYYIMLVTSKPKLKNTVLRIRKLCRYEKGINFIFCPYYISVQ